MPKPKIPKVPDRRRRSPKSSERREIARPMSPQERVKHTRAAESTARQLMVKFHGLKQKLGLRNVTDSNLGRLKRTWEGDRSKAEGLRNLKKVKADYKVALKEAAWAKRATRLGLVRDPKFTQISNLAAFTHDAFRIGKAAEKNGSHYSMAMVDLDHFKRVNDNFGHNAGDVVINHIATMLSDFAKRHGGAAARVGGEEFRVFVPLSSKALVAELTAMQNTFSRELSNPQTFGTKPIKTWVGWKAPSFSAGVNGKKGAGRSAGMDTIISTLSHKSDAALYKAKETRNTVVASR